MTGVSRKALLAAAGASLVAACGGEDDEAREREARAAADLEIVRFLLSVEQVAAAFWEQVVRRRAVAEVDAMDLARDLARNERTHAETLERYVRRQGAEVATAPPPGFAAIFAAGPREILRSGALLGNVAAAAYLGQANRIQDRNVLAAVLAIHTVEGRQAAALNRAAGQDEAALPGDAFAEPLSMSATRSRLRRIAA